MGDAEQPSDSNLVQCEITGKWVPADEIIEIQGCRVCAEGKEELLRRLRSGEAMPGEMERPSLLRRFGCILLDGIAMSAVSWAVMFTVSQLFGGVKTLFARDPAADPNFMIFTAAAALINSVLTLCYFGLMHGLKGQTLGKMAGKTRVVNVDGTPISLKTGFLRALLYIGPGILLPFITLAVPNFFVIQAFNLLNGGYLMANVICALVDGERQRALHDRLAGTRVVTAE